MKSTICAPVGHKCKDKKRRGRPKATPQQYDPEYWELRLRKMGLGMDAGLRMPGERIADETKLVFGLHRFENIAYDTGGRFPATSDEG